jgi:hypothetical protein
MDKEIKVYFAKGGNERRGAFGDRGGRGRPYGDREGFPRRDFEGGPPRRDFSDRPRTCFNCNQEGHMAKDCTERISFIM